jgi:antitoxin VapB
MRWLTSWPGGCTLVEVMNSEIWPLLDDREPISKDERENILGLNPSTGA